MCLQKWDGGPQSLSSIAEVNYNLGHPTSLLLEQTAKLNNEQRWDHEWESFIDQIFNIVTH